MPLALPVITTHVLPLQFYLPERVMPGLARRR
jgi:hypothetical protein